MNHAISSPTQRTLGHTGWQLPSIGIGCWAIGDDYGQLDEATAEATLRAAVECGVRFFDTADGYGQGFSELRLGRYLRPSDEVLVASKVGNFCRTLGAPFSYEVPEHIVECCHASLFRLRRDHIDLYQCHLEDPEHPERFIETFERLREQGLIRAYGISTNSLPALRRFCELGNPAAVQLNYSILNRHPESGLLPFCREHGIGVLVRGPLAKGVLSGKFSGDETFTDRPRRGWSDGNGKTVFRRMIATTQAIHDELGPDVNPVALALRFATDHPAVTCAIPGAKSPQQVRANCTAGERPLGEHERRIIDSHAPAPATNPT